FSRDWSSDVCSSDLGGKKNEIRSITGSDHRNCPENGIFEAMKQLPNLLTLGNLFSGCIAIAFILHAQPFLADFQGMEYWVTGTEQAYWGSLFILLAAILDMLDGAVARALDIHSPIGPDLDSLADLVSFGVAPSMILFKMLWAAFMTDPQAMDVPMMAM